MPSVLSYPGVYIEEVPSGVRTLIGVPTSITAFIGRAARGPINEATTINGFGDFERIFGGLWLPSQLGFAVRDFFLNGGGQAIIVRLYGDDGASIDTAAKATVDAAVGADAAAAAASATAKAAEYVTEPEHSAADKIAKAATAAAALGGATPASVAAAAQAALPPPAKQTTAELTAGGLTLAAASPGRWGTKLRLTVDKNGLLPEVASAMDVGLEALFNITVTDTAVGGVTEFFANLTVRDSARRIDRVLAAESNLVRSTGTLDPDKPPAAARDEVGTAEAAWAAKKRTLTEKQAAGDAAGAATAKDELDAAFTALNSKRKAADDAVTDGRHLNASDFLPVGGETAKHGLYALEQADLFNLLCIPPYKTTDETNFEADDFVVSAATAYCEKRRAIHLIDPPLAWKTKADVITGLAKFPESRSKNAALYFPRLMQPNVLRQGRIESFAPCGAVAGVIARTDAQRGIWKAPGGLEATLAGVPQLAVNLTDAENGELNPLGVNCLRSFPIGGRVVWGSRTTRGADQLADEWKYLPVRRLALFIEESLYRGTQWVVFEPNDEPLWAQIRLNVGAFMQGLFRQQAFQGLSPRDAYFVKCDKETTTQADINAGIVHINVGFAPLKPAEFVVIRLQQMAGQLES